LQRGTKRTILRPSPPRIPIATGTIQKIVDRTSNALLPVYEHIGRIARRFWCNYIDETSWFKQNDLHWLWAMVNERVAFYRIDPHRSKEAFEKLVRDWNGILVSDSYGLYRKWVNRQTCLAHLIRKADALAERKKPDLRRFGEIVAAWLRQLVSFAKAPPDSKQWSDFYTFFLFTISLWENDKTDAGKLARQIVREVDSLWTFLDHQGVDPTNNRAERALRFGVLWRKRSSGDAKRKRQPMGGTDLVYERNLPPKCKTDIPVPRRMYYFLFSKVDAQSFLDLTQTGISRERIQLGLRRKPPEVDGRCEQDAVGQDHPLHDILGVVILDTVDIIGVLPAFGTPQATVDGLVVESNPLYLVAHRRKFRFHPSQSRCRVALLIGAAQKRGDLHD
jgi:hypothetical protein